MQFSPPPLSCQQKPLGHAPSHELGKECFCTAPFCLPIHDHSCVQGWDIKFVSEFSFIVSFLFASISSLSLSTSGLALITVPWFLFPSWPFPPVFLTPFLSQALQSLSVPLIYITAVSQFHQPLLAPALPRYPLLYHSSLTALADPFFLPGLLFNSPATSFHCFFTVFQPLYFNSLRDCQHFCFSSSVQSCTSSKGI